MTPTPLLAVALLLAQGLTMSPAHSAAVAYPPTASVPQTDTQHGIAVADPYRWLEGDVRTEKPVADWVNEQNNCSIMNASPCPKRAAIASSSGRIRACRTSRC